MKKIVPAILLAIAVSACMLWAVSAQAGGLTLSLRRDWGYGGFNGDIQGTFTMSATGPADLVRVEFFIDQTKVGESDTAPFRLQFVTDDYPPGLHALEATGTTSGGVTIRSEAITANFLTASQASRATLGVIVPILVVVFGAIILAGVVPLVIGRRMRSLAPGSARSYPLGGAICPRCSRPFAVHFYGLNLVGRKYDRCPYCGKWSLLHLATGEHLRAAERAELEGAAAQVPEAPAEEKLKKDLDDSKYQDL